MTRKIMAAIFAVTVSTFGVGSASAQVLINAGGATFPEPIYSKWFNEFKKKTGAQINYQPQGSGFGISAVIAGTVDFGASDRPMTDKEIADFHGKHGSNILAFPTVLGANVAVYNIKGVTQSLNLSGQTLAGIFLGKITKWNDPAIANDNKGVNLPVDSIVVVHRTDGSGTTFVWTDYLTKVSPDWEKGPGRGQSVEFPVGLGAKGSEGVAGQVKQTLNSIGYVELTYAVQNKMTYAKVKNAAGVFAEPTLGAITSAAAGAVQAIPDDFRVSITNAPGKDSYPISTFTWLLIPDQFADANKKKAIIDFIKWALADGQNLAEPLYYAKLPKSVVDKEMKAIAKFK
jgi:phosphate transport system substrate-binding protein